MATERKLNDPTEAALSAIEQALKLEPAHEATAPRPDDGAEPRLPDVDDRMLGPALPASDTLDLAEPEPTPAEPFDRVSEAPGTVVRPDRAAVANDDREAVGLLLQALQRRPSRRPYIWAALFSLLWIGSAVAYVATRIEGGPAAFLASLTPVQTVAAAAALLGPVILFFVAAMLALRSQEMRLVARAGGEVAIRLAQPESFSTEAVMSVSQAVRRQVAAVGDGVERALARAGELETLVRSEVSTLQRAYSENEIRVSALVAELAAEREAIVASAERVRNAIGGSHQTLAQELDATAYRIVEDVGAVGQRVAETLARRGTEIASAIAETGEQMIGDMAGHGSGLVERLNGTSETIRAGMTDAELRLVSSLEKRAEEVGLVFQRTGTILGEAVSDRALQVTRGLAETGSGIVEALARQGAEVRETFERAAGSVESSFVARGTELSDRLAATAA